jgi:hypothetical protein
VRERDDLHVDDGGQSVRESRLSARTSVRVSTVPPSSDELWNGLIGVPDLELRVERTGEQHHLGSDVRGRRRQRRARHTRPRQAQEGHTSDNLTMS